jgi:dUTP pyrophosphatase
MITRIEFKKLRPDAKVPSKSRDTDAGYDITTVDAGMIGPAHAQYKALILPTGIAISCPPGFYYEVAGRSSLLTKGIVPAQSIIDSTYTGELHIVLFNLTNMPYNFEKGDRIAQIIFHKVHELVFAEVENFGTLYNQRGTNGYGSSGR